MAAYIEWDDSRRIPYLYRGPDIGDARARMALNDSDKRTYVIQRRLELTARAITDSHTREALLPVTSNFLRRPQTLWYAPEGEAKQREWSGVVLDFSPTPASSEHPARTSGELLRRFFVMLHPAGAAVPRP